MHTASHQHWILHNISTVFRRGWRCRFYADLEYDYGRCCMDRCDDRVALGRTMLIGMNNTSPVKQSYLTIQCLRAVAAALVVFSHLSAFESKYLVGPTI